MSKIFFPNRFPKRLAFFLVFSALVFVPTGLMAYKLYALHYPLAGLIPVTSYTVDINMQVDGHGESIQIRTYLPQNDNRQIISGEVNSSGEFLFSLTNDGNNKVGSWVGENLEGGHSVRYSFDVQAQHVRYEIPENLSIPVNYPKELQAYLIDEPGINKDDPLIAAELEKIMPGTPPRLLEAVTRIHRHLQDDFKNRNFSGFTDSLTALKLGEASCNGKSRLFLALARRLNIPARLVGGFIMTPGTKRVSHQWVEIYANGHWVPFDTINDHFAEIPSNFLTLYQGDQVLFKHTTNVNFKYHFKTVRKVVPRKEVQAVLGSSSLNTLNLYSLFERIGIPQNLLKLILMIPLGALVTVIFRNVIGLETFGTFLPALIASAARDTGLLWGIIGFMAIILSCALVRKALDWMELLHSPKMAVLLTTVVIVMLGLTTLGVSVGLFDLAHITLFPIAILAITAERFALIDAEQGFAKAMKISLATIVVIAAAYAVMNSLFLQSLILAFPELLLVVMAINLWLGKWIGLRVVEFIRFRKLIFQGVGT